METMKLNHILDENPELFISRKKAARAEAHQQLLQDLKKAVQLGNFYNEPVTIEYYDKQGNSQQKEAILSTVTEKYAVTRGGQTIGLNKIKSVLV